MNDLFNNPQKPKFKPKRCAECKNEFTPIKPLQKYCGPVCFWEAGKKKLALKEKKENQEWKEKEKEKLMSLTDWKDKLQIEINKIVHLIDKGQPCIASQATKCQFHAGHYVSRGSNDTIRFNLHNIHKQAAQSNAGHMKSGDTINYQDGLKRVYGLEYFEMVESLRKIPPIKLTIEDLKDKIVIARLIIKDLKSWANTYDAKERIEMRVELNFRLGIYKTQQ